MIRKLLNTITARCILNHIPWRWLRFYPPIIPRKHFLRQCNVSNSEVYQRWLDKHALATISEWQVLRKNSLQWNNPPRISIVTPVYNTAASALGECILSVRTQAYPYWELILVDDGSSLAETHSILCSALCSDPRIQVFYSDRSKGISASTNDAIEKAYGDYVLFLDHDDRLSLDALYFIAEQIRKYPETDIVYADRDMIAPDGTCHMHLFKPDWSPETLLSGNYIFHPMCYRRDLLSVLGGLRSQFDGSQDYDLVLRASETNPKVRHVQRILYHWRQHEASVSATADAKHYVFDAGIRALKCALKRRGLSGTASEITTLWRGNYRVDLQPAGLKDILWINVPANLDQNKYAGYITDAVEREINGGQSYIAIISDAFSPLADDAVTRMAAWLKLDGVGLATPRIVTAEGRLHYAGMAYKKDGSLIVPYQGFPSSEPGYMAVTSIARNISAPHPRCVTFRRELWSILGGFDSKFQGSYALWDFGLRAYVSGFRCVMEPHAQFITERNNLLDDFLQQERPVFQKKWSHWLKNGDPYYNRNLAEDSRDMGLAID